MVPNNYSWHQKEMFTFFFIKKMQKGNEIIDEEKKRGGFHSLLKEIPLETYGPEVYLQPFAI